MKKAKIGRIKNVGAKLITAALAGSLMCSTMSAFAITAINPADELGANGGKYFSSYTSNEELQKVTKETNIELATEGAILLKNGGGADGTENKLPYTNMKNISVFGINSDAFGYGGTGSGSGQLEEGADIYNSFEHAGISINPKLKALYQKYSGGSLSAKAAYTTPTYEDKELDLSYYTDAVQASYARYSDAAFIVISRLGGEGADLKTENVDNHIRPDKDGTLKPTSEVEEYKDEHYLELTYREEQLIKHVEEHFDKVVVLYNAGNVIEMGELQDDPKIDAIVHINQTGDYGFDGILKLLKGEVNPSGRTVDILTRDFTVDPTFQNFGDGSQTVENGTNYSYQWKAEGADAKGAGINMVEYEEGIYLGYKYYETMYSEIKAGNVDLTAAETKAVLGSKDLGNEYADGDDWYAKNVVYPFGYGLSYTTFDWDFTSLEMSTETLSADTTFTATVTVTNTGTVAGKDVVELYMSAPYTAGGIEKAAVQLVGFEKTALIQPGESDTVQVKFDAYDIAAYDYSDANQNSFVGYEIEAGDYTFTARANSHDVKGTQTKALTELQLAKSQATGVTISNVFKKYDAEAHYNYTSISPTMTIMTRGDMIGTFPTAPTADELLLEYNENTINPIAENKEYQITAAEMYNQMNFGFIFGRDNEDHELWADVTIPDNWTQAADDKGEVKIRLADLMGVDPYDDETAIESENAEIDGKTGKEAWDLFMNQLTYEEMKLLNTTGFFKTAAVERVGKEEAVDPDGPCCIGGQTKDGYISARGPSGTRYWCSASTVACTWNKELAHRIGVLIGEEGMWNGYNGWYAPSMNTHRSPFSGRNFEYYSQDGVHGGLIAGAVISGVSSRGIYPYIKHFALNDQETSRNNIATWADEQTIRENILRPFQYAVQQGGSCGVMTGFNRIGAVGCTDNYPLLTSILREEWGFNGTVVTDYQVGTVGNALNNLEIMTRAGNNIPLGDRAVNARGNGTWDATLRNGKGGVKVGKVTMEESKNQWGQITFTPVYSTTEFVQNQKTTEISYYYTRIRAMELLHTYARSNAIDNGADFLKNFAAQTIELPAKASASKLISATFAEGSDVWYEIVESKLPDGVNFNLKDLSLSTNGRAEVSTGTITLKVHYDSWASKKVQFKVNVVQSAKYDGKLAVAKGAAYDATVSQDFWAAVPDLGEKQPGIVSVTPSVTGLPEGLSFNATTGKISGTPTVAGEYNLTVNYKVVTRSVDSSGNVNDNAADYKSNYTLTVGDLVTVTVNGNAQKIEKGSKLTAPVAPTAPEGQRFVGWYAGENEFDFDTAIEADTVIEAKFEAIPDDIQFRVENGKIQASINGGEWTDVIEVEDLKGEKGETGATGPAGPAGKDGADAKGGCGSSIGVVGAASAIGMIGLAVAGCFVLRGKKED